jgi:hypothetical protein
LKSEFILRKEIIIEKNTIGMSTSDETGSLLPEKYSPKTGKRIPNKIHQIKKIPKEINW